jgi:hypothetical protein
VLFETFIAVLRPLANQRCGAIALVSNDTLSLGGAVALFGDDEAVMSERMQRLN